MRLMKYVAQLAAFALIVVAYAVPTSADVRLPALFSEHMVVQTGMDVPVWGWADPNEEVTVELAGSSAKGKADSDGKWRVKLAPLAVGGPHTMKVSGKNRLSVADVLVGEVWLGSGQSNMAMTVSRCFHAEDEAKISDLPQVGMFTVRSTAADQPQADCNGEWVVCKPDTVGGFSATLFFTGREIHKALRRPVGLINSSVGGTPIESWIDAATQRAEPKVAAFVAAIDDYEAKWDAAAATANYEKQLARWKQLAAKAKADGKPIPKKPNDPIENRARKGGLGGLFNGKINPLVGYALRGALWYQGEANSQPGKSQYYGAQLAMLVSDWRSRWGQGDFPFAWVQLPNFSSNRPDWLVVRDEMRKTLALPHTGMAVTTDIGEQDDIHPRNKQDVGKRLALWALATVYGKPVGYMGPLYKSATPSGDRIVVGFDFTDGIAAAGGKPLTGFEIAGADKKWKAADAKIAGTNVVVSSAEVPQPLAVRYNWAELPTGNLTNGTGLPASPFRSKAW